MGFFAQFKRYNTDELIKEARQVEGHVIIDVRGESEVAGGVVPGAIWIPMDHLELIMEKVSAKDTPIFVYCGAGVRAERAKTYWESLGYTNITNAGGSRYYTGELAPLA